MQRTVTSPGTGCTVVDLGGLTLAFAVAESAAPRDGTGPVESALRVVESLRRASGSPITLAHLAAFVADAGSMPRHREAIRAFYGPEAPAVSMIAQPPLSGAEVAIEAWGVVATDGVRVDRPGEHLVRVAHGDHTWTLCAHAEPRPGTTGVYNQTVSALSSLRRQLARIGVPFEQTVRTWYYLGGITVEEDCIERYKELNRARASFYEGVQFLAECDPPGLGSGALYPASTGIGASDREVRLACLALQGAGHGVRVTPLENPRQTSAFQYSARYSPRSPQFARAMALTCGRGGAILVSGTASITDSESRHLGDVVAQTHQTLDNIELLISEANLRRHGLPGLGATLADLVQARVYVKHAEDFEPVRAACDARIGRLPMVYVQADVCRSELLVEIEAIARCGSPDD